MKRSIAVFNVDELRDYRNVINNNLKQGMVMLQKLINSVDTLSFFKSIKYEKTVIEPLTGQPENLLEVINQCQTYLVSIMALEYLFAKHSDISFRINFGNVSGYDIESEDGRIIAECFAATSYRSNGKLTKDLKRLAGNQKAIHKYEFFYDTEFTDIHKNYYQKQYPDIEIVKFEDVY